MATIRKRGSSWQVQVRKKDFPTMNRSFRTKDAAVLWSRELERGIELGELPTTVNQLKGLTLALLLTRYESEVTSHKKGASQERYLIGSLKREGMCQIPLSSVRSSSIAAYRDRRSQIVAGATVRRELAVVSHCYEIARKEWNIAVRNPVKDLRLPGPSKARDRRLNQSEIDAAELAIDKSRTWYLLPLVRLALETGMRRGELLSLRWAEVNLNARTARLTDTKNGDERTVPLSRRAVEILSDIDRSGELVFPVRPGAVRQAWERMIKRAGLLDFRFHDLRHESISRFFELGLSVPEAALISGHKDVRMLFRYTHLKASSVADKIDQLNRTRDTSEGDSRKLRYPTN